MRIVMMRSRSGPYKVCIRFIYLTRYLHCHSATNMLRVEIYSVEIRSMYVELYPCVSDCLEKATTSENAVATF